MASTSTPLVSGPATQAGVGASVANRVLEAAVVQGVQLGEPETQGLLKGTVPGPLLLAPGGPTRP